ARPQEIEIAALVRLKHVLHKHRVISTAEALDRGLSVGKPPLDLRVVHQQIQAPAWHIEADFISGLNNPQRSPYGGLRRDMQNYRPEAGPAHPRVANPHHIVYALS